MIYYFLNDGILESLAYSTSLSAPRAKLMKKGRAHGNGLGFRVYWNFEHVPKEPPQNHMGQSLTPT